MIIEVHSDVARAIFMALPGETDNVYPDYCGNEDAAEEAALLDGKHILSDTFEFKAYLFLGGDALSLDNCLARIALIIPRENEDAYFGYFSARPSLHDINDLMSHVEAEVKALGRKRLIGPVNGSFWLGYRFKIDRFDAKPYYGEPRNPARYPELFTACSYEILESYRSNIYLKGAAVPPRMRKRLRQFREKGYDIRRPKRSETRQLLKDIYRLITKLYADFPAFQAISEDQFYTLFKGLPLIADYKLIRIARYHGSSVAFLIALPDYGTKLDPSRRTISKIKAIINKRRLKQVVLLYLAVEKDHLGLGPAMISDFSEEIARRNCSVVGALIAGDKVSASYAGNGIMERRHYALFAKVIE